MVVAALLAALWFAPSPSLAAPEAVVLLMPGVRRELTPVARGDAELLPLDALLTGLGVGMTSDARAGAVTLSYDGREVSLFHRKNLASVGGDLRLLSSACLLEGGTWLVPVDALPRLLGPLLGLAAEWRPAARVLVLGAVRVARVQVTTDVSGDSVRVVLQASEKLPFRVDQQPGRVSVAMPGDLVEVDFQQERLTGGIISLVQFVGGRENVLAVTLGPRFASVEASEQVQPSRLTLEFRTSAARAPESAGAAPAPPPRVLAGAERGPRTLVIDPGHGGADQGAHGPGGVLEKDVTLALARKLRAAIVNGLGWQVFLTRERDEDVSLDQRTAIANNYKADLFVSLHANSSRGPGAHGSEVYFLAYQASDDDGRRVAQAEGAIESAADPQAPAPGSELALILWDMAQAEHLEESSALASRIQEALAEVTGSQGRGVKQAPFRVLVGAAMPAVLVEAAFISNPDEEKLLASDAWQSRVAQALMRGIARFERDGAQSAGATP